MSNQSKAERELVELVASFEHDPCGFWDTLLPDEIVLDSWQREVLEEIAWGLKRTPKRPVRVATVSGNGSGKSFLFGAAVPLWALYTAPDTRVVITANTFTQLQTKTHAELSKIFYMLPVPMQQWFTLSATALVSSDPRHARTHRADLIPWSETSVESFSGLHNQNRRAVLIFDEASGISDEIFKVSEGAMSEANTELIWCVAGNGTRPSGAFYECFHRQAHRWKTWHIDTRTSKLSNKEQIAEWEADQGADSDWFKVHVRGMFPSAGSLQFIGHELVAEAVTRRVEVTKFDPLVFGVDVARQGDDQSVIAMRQGRDARSMPWIKLRNVDTMALAARVAQLADELHPSGILVDGGGIGAGVIDRLRQLKVRNVFEIQFGSKPTRSMPGQDSTVYANRRAEMYGVMREWLKGGAIPDDSELRADLVAPEYRYVMRDGRDAILLESKDDMRRRGLPSTDRSDALALTFALPVSLDNPMGHQRPNGRVISEYDPFADTAESVPERTARRWNAYENQYELETLPTVQTDWNPFEDR